MTLAANGDWDQVIELDRILLTHIAQATMPTNAEPINVEKPEFEAVVSAIASVKELWFRERPKGWGLRSGFGTLRRGTFNMITLGIEVSVHVDLKKVLIELGGEAVVADLTSKEDANNDGIEDFQPLRNIDFRAYVEVHDLVEVQKLAVRAHREATETALVPCVVIDFNPSVGIPRNWPGIDIRIKESDLRTANAVKLMMAAAVIRADGDGNAGEAAFQGLIKDFTDQLSAALSEILSNMEDWRIAEKGKSLLYEDAKSLLYPEATNTPRPILKMGVRTLDESLIIGMDILLARGNTTFLQNSTLKGRERFGVTISNRMFLRSVVREALIKQFKLSPKDFDPSEYCVLRRPVQGARLMENRTGSLNSLWAFVNDLEQLRILIGFSTEVFPGVTLHVNLDLFFKLSVERSITGADQVLQIKQILINPKSAIASKRVDVHWAIYLAAGGTAALLGGLVAGVLALLVTVIIDEIILEMIAAGELEKAMDSLVSTVEKPVPLPITLTSPILSLYNDDATPMPTPLGTLFAHMFGARTHDLHIGANYSSLPDSLHVTFQVVDSDDPGSRLDGIGGLLEDGTEWALPIDDAIKLVDAGRYLYVDNAGNKTQVVSVTGKNGTPYLRTKADDFGENNLANLPKRVIISAISSELGSAIP